MGNLNRLKRKIYGVFSWDQKRIAIVLSVLFVIGLLPILYLSGYVHATGDDFGYGSRAHQAWLASHNLWQTFAAAAGTVKQFWHGWQGTWFTIFFMALQPEVFHPGSYWIVPWLMLAVNIGATTLVLHYFLVKRLQLLPSAFWCADLLVLTAMIQFFPSTKSGIFWYNGTVHYILPYGIAMAAIYSFLRFAEAGSLRWAVMAFFCMAALGGSSYLAALLAAIILVYIIIWNARRKKYVFWLLIPLMAEFAGLYVSMISPGNKARGGEDFGFHFNLAILTVLRCFREGAVSMIEYARKYPAALLMMAAAFFLIYEAFREQEQPVLSFRFPGLFAVLSFATWCAMFAPGLYAGVELSGGVPNTIWQTFLLALLAAMTYFAGWAAVRRKAGAHIYERGRVRTRLMLPFMLLCVIWVFLHKGTLKDTTFYECYDFIATGQAADYKAQMDERLKLLLDPSLKEVELPAMNSEQGPFMHMEVLEDPDGWTNTVVAQFFGKDRVVEVPRGN